MKRTFRAAVSLLLSLTLSVSSLVQTQLLSVYAAEASNWYQTWQDIGQDEQFRYAATDDLDFYDHGFGVIMRECLTDDLVFRVPDVYQNDSNPVIGIEYDGTTVHAGEGVRRRSMTVPFSVEWVTLYDPVVSRSG